MPNLITDDEFLAIVETVESLPVPVYDPSQPIDDDLWTSIVSAVDQMKVSTPTTVSDTTPLDPHRPGHTSFYYFVGYFAPTVDGASSLRRTESLDDAPIHRIALSYKQAQYLDLIK